MRYHALACDYDGTVADEGLILPATRAAFARLRASGRRVVLVTGRRLDDLMRVCPDLAMFDAVVAENGALTLRPPAKEPRLLGPPASEKLLERLRARGVAPLDEGAVIIATTRPHDVEVLDAISALGLELQVIFNRGAVMVLPSGINKATGLEVALTDLGLSPHDVVAVGDGENDHALLSRCEVAVAVADAIPSLKEAADIVTRSPGSAGVVELVDALLSDDLATLEPRSKRHQLAIGARADGSTFSVPTIGGAVLCAGTSGGGKSTIVSGILERLTEQRYQYCIIDPEGDHDAIGANDSGVALGAANRPPTVDEAVAALASPGRDVVVNLLGLPLDDRPRFCAVLLSRLVELRARFGRPHWIVIDEAHHVLPRDWQATEAALPDTLENLLMVTVHPLHVAPKVLKAVSLVLTVGQEPGATLREAAEAMQAAPPASGAVALQPGEALAWTPRTAEPPFKIRPFPARAERKRHARKYAEGELRPDESFYFRGPDGRLNLRAQNLRLFLQIAEGVDDDTWLHHLRRGDYSRWFRADLKDPELADEAAAIERTPQPAGEPDAIYSSKTRARIRAAIDARYGAAV